MHAVFVAIVTLIALSIFDIKYALLIAIVIGFTNVIPFFGPFLGGIPCFFLILIVDPIKAVWFGIFIIVLQQVDGNVIKPVLFGETMGLPAIWVLVSIILFGGLFGIIGMLIGAWIASGTVPTMIYYGLQIISAEYFLVISALMCAIVSFAIGAWGTVGTVGIAFMGIGLALDIPAPIVAGSIISGSYMGEVCSPLSDAVNLTAAVVERSPFDLMRRSVKPALIAIVIAEIGYFIIGLGYGGNDAAVAESIAPILKYHFVMKWYFYCICPFFC